MILPRDTTPVKSHEAGPLWPHGTVLHNLLPTNSPGSGAGERKSYAAFMTVCTVDGCRGGSAGARGDLTHAWHPRHIPTVLRDRDH
jgi:hypothetical protein